ncbi:PH domain-containing protein [Candidatus Parcubacteria bacterium]|nr:PH domain-containing protein [Candidatus Parcubacteria bacterium]
MSIFTSSKNSFEGQLPGETTILLTRKHWLNLFVPLFINLLLILLPFVVYFIINSFSWYDKISSLYWFLATLLLLILWNLAFYNIMIYALNTVLVTNKRVIENKQEGLFKHRINELELDKVQDISIKVFGLLAELLSFGNLEIQSAGAKVKFSFTQLPHPQKIKNTIMKLKIS